MRFHVASPNAQHGVALVNVSVFLLSSHICSSGPLLSTTPVRQLFSASRPKEQARNSRSPFDLFHFTQCRPAPAWIPRPGLARRQPGTRSYARLPL